MLIGSFASLITLAQYNTNSARLDAIRDRVRRASAWSGADQTERIITSLRRRADKSQQKQSEPDEEESR